MKKNSEYTDEHASCGVDAELPAIETWLNQYGEYEIDLYYQVAPIAYAKVAKIIID